LSQIPPSIRFSLHGYRFTESRRCHPTDDIGFELGWCRDRKLFVSCLAAIYRDASRFPGQTAINTITSMALEWGRGGLLIAMFLLLQLLVVLFRGALSRGRDSL
jgi:hypothetical protein